MSERMMSGLLSVGCGGRADVEIVTDVKDLRVREGDIVMGRGTNLLAPDEGVAGRVLVMRCGRMRAEGNVIYAEAGAPVAAVARLAARLGLSGLEWAEGIPGSVGGAIVMNAGAFGGETGGVLAYADVVGREGAERLPASALTFGYRRTEGLTGVVMGGAFALARGDTAEIAALMRRYAERRRLTQPHGRTFGSVFKRVDGVSAGYFLDRAGMKGRRRGGAVVSDVHANFIVNTGGATTSDVLALMSDMEKAVSDAFGVRLEPEVVLLPSAERGHKIT